MKIEQRLKRVEETLSLSRPKLTAAEVTRRVIEMFGAPLTVERLRLAVETETGRRRRIAELALKAWGLPSIATGV